MRVFLHIGSTRLKVRDDFQESKHPRDPDGKFATGSGGGSSSGSAGAHKVLSQPMQIGSAAIKNLQDLIKKSEGEEKKQLQQHLATTYLKKHLSLKSKGSANAQVAFAKFKKFPQEMQNAAMAKLKVSPEQTAAPVNPASAPAHATPEMSFSSSLLEKAGFTAQPQDQYDKIASKVFFKGSNGQLASVDKDGKWSFLNSEGKSSHGSDPEELSVLIGTSVTHSASPAEIEKAKSKNPYPYYGTNSEVKALVDEFNKKYSGDQTPATTTGLKQKVIAFKQMKSKVDALQKEQQEKEAAEAEKALGENAESYKDLKEMDGASLAKGYIKYAQEKINHHGITGITAGEAAHIAAYSGNAYVQTNKALRAGVMNEVLWKHVKQLNAALERLPPHVGVTRRGAKLSSSQQALYQPGMIVEERGFMSTSRGSGWKGTKFIVHGKSGRDISKLSYHPGEQEVLFQSGTHFKVISNDGNTIVLHEVD